MDQAFRGVPLQWLDGERETLEELLERLMKRRGLVAGLLDDCRRAKPASFPNWR
jgi:hypothetical protein